jgi:hypothetical protein
LGAEEAGEELGRKLLIQALSVSDGIPYFLTSDPPAYAGGFYGGSKRRDSPLPGFIQALQMACSRGRGAVRGRFVYVGLELTSGMLSRRVHAFS